MRRHIKYHSSPIQATGRAPAERDISTSLSLSDLLQAFLRHKLFIAVCVVLSLGIAAAYLSVAKPVFEASSTLRIDPSRASSLGLSDLLSESAGGFGMDATATEIAILKSDVVAIDTLDSLTDAQFEQYAHNTKAALGFGTGNFTSTPANEGLLGRFKAALKVKQVEGTQLVAISVRDQSPQLAAMLANGVVSSYRKQSFDSRYASVTQVSDWLSAEMSTLKDRASEAQRKLAAFQEKNNILGTDPANNTTIDRLRLLNNRLAQAQSDRIVKEAQLRAASTQAPAVLASLFPDAHLTALQSQQGTLYAQYAMESAKFGANYPPLMDLKKQMAKVDAEIERSVETARGTLKEEYDASNRTEGMLQKQYDDQTGKAYLLNREQAEYAVLQAEGTSSRELYDTLQYKLQQAGVVAGLNGVNTMPVDRARAPLRPVEPKVPVVLGFGLAAGLFVGVGASFLKEAVSERVQSGEQLERVLGYPLLAVIPHLGLKLGGPRLSERPGMAERPGLLRTSGARLITYIEPQSRGAEAYRTLRNSFLLSSDDQESKTVLITSTLAEEGKSSTAVNYAVVLAQKGARVLLLDADLRRPALHTHFGIENGDGLTNLLLDPQMGDVTVRPLAQLDNLNLITAGRHVALPSEALASARFRALVEQWEQQYDFVLIDSAPLLIVSDSLPLASMADAVILVTRYNATPMKAVARVRDVLARIDAHVAGVLLNNVPVSTATYGGNGYGYYQ